RFKVGDDRIAQQPVARWVQLAFHDALIAFAPTDDQATAAEVPRGFAGSDPLLSPMPSPSVGPRAGFVDQSIVLDQQTLDAPLVPQNPRPAGAPRDPQAADPRAAFPPTFVVRPTRG